MLARDGRLPVGLAMALMSGVIALVIPVTFLVYGGADDPAKAYQLFLDRAAEQGEMWFLADRDFGKLFAFDVDAIAADAKSWIGIEAQDPTAADIHYGLYYVMARFAPRYVLRDYMRNEMGFIFDLYPFWLIVSGYIGLLLVTSIIACQYAFVLSETLIAICTYQWIGLAIIGKIMVWLMAGFSSGYTWNFFGYKTMAFIVILVILRGISKVASLVPSDHDTIKC
jgi:hypothetical protein